MIHFLGYDGIKHKNNLTFTFHLVYFPSSVQNTVDIDIYG